MGLHKAFGLSQKHQAFPVRCPTQETARSKATQLARAEDTEGVKSSMAVSYFLHLIKVKYTCDLEVYFYLVMKGLKRNTFAAQRQNDLAGSILACASSSFFLCAQLLMEKYCLPSVNY